MSSEPESHTASDGPTPASPPPWDSAVTIVLLAVLGALSLLCLLGLALNVAPGSCSFHPATCDKALLAFAEGLGWIGLPVILCVAVGLSVVLLAHKRRAFYVPALGIAALLGCFTIWDTLVSRAVFG